MKYLGLYLQSLRAPVKTASCLKRNPPGETTLVVWAYLAVALSFLARLPSVIASAQQTDAPNAFTGAQLGTSLIFGPLFLYFLAFCSHVVVKFLGGQGTGAGARVALFWTLLLMLPFVLMKEILRVAVVVPGLHSAISVLLMLVFFVVWGRILRVFEQSEN